MRLPDPPLLVVTDRRQARRPLEHVAAACFEAGCRWLSLREKDLRASERLHLLRRLVALGDRHGATVGVHDDVTAALASGAGALHMPDISIAPVQAGGRASLVLGPGLRRDDDERLRSMVIGISAHNAAGVARATAQGADYATLSPIFVSASKPEYGPAIGVERLADAARSTALPLIALGGIDAAVVSSLVAAGAAGVAVMGEVMRAGDPARVVAALVAALAAARPQAIVRQADEKESRP